MVAGAGNLRQIQTFGILTVSATVFAIPCRWTGTNFMCTGIVAIICHVKSPFESIDRLRFSSIFNFSPARVKVDRKTAATPLPQKQRRCCSLLSIVLFNGTISRINSTN
jgi:hypothetical protein